ncbi:hypothetical protein I552_0193 [Mycobacterium xenopi 3993]|nr:hypothetical protein I552_0193 [Mycobacterium xenopi 3993]
MGISCGIGWWPARPPPRCAGITVGVGAHVVAVLAGADLGRVAKAGAVNRVMLRRAWAAGAAPDGDRLTIDPDATRVAT